MAPIVDPGTSAYVRSEVVAGFHGEEIARRCRARSCPVFPAQQWLLRSWHDDAIRIQHGGRGSALTGWRGASETR